MAPVTTVIRYAGVRHFIIFLHAAKPGPNSLRGSRHGSAVAVSILLLEQYPDSLVINQIV